jgi:hypothetical protein
MQRIFSKLVVIKKLEELYMAKMVNPHQRVPLRTQEQMNLQRRLLGLAERTSKSLSDVLGRPMQRQFLPIRREALASFDRNAGTLAQRFTNFQNREGSEEIRGLFQSGRPALQAHLNVLEDQFASQRRDQQLGLLQLLLGGGLSPSFQPIYRQPGQNVGYSLAGAAFGSLPYYFNR